jgi:hypothetical protein
VQFERVYGSSAERRVRVQLSRALDEAMSQRSQTPVANWRWLYGSLAAAAVVLLAVSVWFGQQKGRQTAAINPTPSASPSTASSPAPQPGTFAPPSRGTVIVAVTLSPIAVRAVDEAESLIVPPGTELISLTVEGVEQTAATTAVSAVVRTVAGQDAWRGNALSTTPGSSQARFEIPADRLPPDDYIVTVYGLAADQERELQRYSLRVRAR